MHRLAVAEYVAHHIGAMQPREDVLALADVAVDEGRMVHGVERGDESIAAELADLAFYREGGDALDELLTRLPPGDDVGDRDLRELVLLREGGDFGAALDASVAVHESGEYAHGRQPREPAKVDAGFGMARAHQHAALTRDQWKDVAGPDEIGRAHVGIGERA